MLDAHNAGTAAPSRRGASAACLALQGEQVTHNGCEPHPMRRDMALVDLSAFPSCLVVIVLRATDQDN
jgi:hypothetical protein